MTRRSSVATLYPDQIRTYSSKLGDGTCAARREIIPNFVVDADMEKCHEYVELGAFIEHEVGQYDPLGNKKWSPTAPA